MSNLLLRTKAEGGFVRFTDQIGQLLMTGEKWHSTASYC